VEELFIKKPSEKKHQETRGVKDEGHVGRTGPKKIHGLWKIRGGKKRGAKPRTKKGLVKNVYPTNLRVDSKVQGGKS